ncbi:hypothetical protein EV356DRAFT_538322 [Viridothelium virens]|uniref:Uncharacterized protein n=1 Tax=Viridothelium virens TaxID=1048519 RepID=A0A6A6GSQ1_VIRVR|nr:hypothetical protein EV356DRAFT_538322 [Viridothelium virens]
MLILYKIITIIITTMAAPAASAAPAPPIAAVLAASLFRPGPAPILGIREQQLALLTYNP